MSGQRELFDDSAPANDCKIVLAGMPVEPISKYARLLRNILVPWERSGSGSPLVGYPLTATTELPHPLKDRKKPRGGWLPGLFRISIALSDGAMP